MRRDEALTGGDGRALLGDARVLLGDAALLVGVALVLLGDALVLFGDEVLTGGRGIRRRSSWPPVAKGIGGWYNF